MNRNKIEKYILSQHHYNNPNLIFGLTALCSLILLLIMLIYII